MKNPRFLIVVTGYNCEAYVDRCLKSLGDQSYKNFSVSIIDDGSTDGTKYAIYKRTIPERPVYFWPLRSNKGTFFARHIGITVEYFTSDHVIALLDMDDALLPDALETVAKEYEKGAWMTYGNYQFESGEKNPLPIHYPDTIHENRDYRKDVFRCTHLRTFRRELYEMIPQWDLTPAEINSYPEADLLFSMMEMCGKERIGVIEKPIYIYNNTNPLSTLNRFGKDHEGYAEICSRPKRDLLTTL